ncbi:MAG: leucine-rich repeat domain-containing protein [Lentimicrobium sp.]|nr:leucine-rich repeat domain-containing protein [Lentimicrobium sp.]
MNDFKRCLIVFFVLFLAWFSGFSQNPVTTGATEQQVIPDEELSNYQKQATQLIGFMEFAFNTIGSKGTEYREKDIIINQSYLKFFRDAKVQVEDDLVEKRDVVTNKDIQAYLKDIDFFFREVAFKYTVEEITQEVNEKGETFFKVKTSRNLKGKTVEGLDINENRPRFIEINLDPASRDLKIVSIYTTRSSEEQELMAWWNSLDKVWRNYFSGETVLKDGYRMGFIQQVGRGFLVVDSEISKTDTTLTGDTLRVDPGSLLAEVRKIWRIEQLDLSGIENIYSLEPLSAFSFLRHLNISGTRVSDLSPIRNLSKLETLIASSSQITSLEPVQYTTGVKFLDISSTLVSDIQPVENFQKLEYLNLSGTPLKKLGNLSGLSDLRELKISNLPLYTLNEISGMSSLEVLDLTGLAIEDFSGLSGLEGLTRIVLTKTNIADLEILSALTKLQYIHLDYSPVSSIQPLLKLPDLKAVYCDKTLIDKQTALSFIENRPEVKVIYASEELSVWWANLSEAWKAVFRSQVEVSDPPEREQLYEVSNLRKIDISGNADIADLAPVTKLPSLSQLDASLTGITSISDVKDLPGLRELYISKTPLVDLTPLSGLKGLSILNISDTKVTDISPLAGLRNLKRLDMDNVQAADARVLVKLDKLETLFADGSPSVSKVVDQLWDSIPDILVIFQTPELLQWWQGLPTAWKNVFAEIEPFADTPGREKLHRIAGIKTLDINRNRDISSLLPVSQLKRLEVLKFSGTQIADMLPVGLIKRLKELDCSNTPVSDIAPVTTHRNLEILNCSNTQISKIDNLKYLSNLRILDISGTKVTRLNALTSSVNLNQLICFNTRISNLKPLESLNKLQVLKIYNTRVSKKNIDKLRASKPNIEVVYY